jgi:polyisoprenoid-binding protein YceI
VKKVLAGVGVLALVVWTASGFACWLLTREHVTVVLEQGERTRALPEDPLPALVARMEELAERQDALAQGLEQSLTTLDERAAERAREARCALEAELAALRAVPAAPAGSVEASQARSEVAEPPGALAGDAAPAGSEAPPTAAPAPAGEQPATRSSFLAFNLPKDDFRFDERRSWTILPAQSRVGFDARSTLHDFTGTSVAVRGSLAFEPAHPGLEPRGDVRVEAASLDTGNDARDEEMHEHLDAARQAEIAFHLTGFEPAEIDPARGRVSGIAHGMLIVRGAERPFSMPVTATIDAARRLLLEGEAPLALPDFGVPVPSKLGLISMEDTVVVWIALRARLEARESS